VQGCSAAFMFATIATLSTSNKCTCLVWGCIQAQSDPFPSAPSPTRRLVGGAEASPTQPGGSSLYQIDRKPETMQEYRRLLKQFADLILRGKRPRNP
jgi:hypothetical protein